MAVLVLLLITVRTRTSTDTRTLMRLLSLPSLRLEVVLRRRRRLAYPRLALAVIDRLQAVDAVRVVHVERTVVGGTSRVAVGGLAHLQLAEEDGLQTKQADVTRRRAVGRRASAPVAR